MNRCAVCGCPLDWDNDDYSREEFQNAWCDACLMPPTPNTYEAKRYREYIRNVDRKWKLKLPSE